MHTTLKTVRDIIKIGLILCNYEISYHGGKDDNNVLELEQMEGDVCPDCIVEYMRLTKGDKNV